MMMVELGEWNVVVDLSSEVSDELAADVLMAVTAALRSLAAGTEIHLQRNLGVTIELRTSGLSDFEL
jgi:hypothetical protein